MGAYCTYFPQEIAMAMGAAQWDCVPLPMRQYRKQRGISPKNLCPLIKSSYGFAKTDKCPFFYFSDVVVGGDNLRRKEKDV